ncbi:MAG: S-layer homology domain-containing protein [Clostridia bacterium]|nr:S-layer homology domain-containing protein [Clostridia bacterium]
MKRTILRMIVVTVCIALIFSMAVFVPVNAERKPESIGTVCAAYKGYPDVPKAAWFYTAVKYVSEKGYMSGYKTGKFGPGDKLQRQDFAVLLANIAGAPLYQYADSNGYFPDVQKRSYYAPSVAWASDKGYILGYSPHDYGVGHSITRQDLCVILNRCVGSSDAYSASEMSKKYRDWGKVSPYAQDSVAWAVKNGVISGMADGRLAPTEAASRAMIAQILMNMDKAGKLNLIACPYPISENEAYEIACRFWNYTPGMTSSDGKPIKVFYSSVVTSTGGSGARYYKFLLRWLVNNSYYSTIDMVYVSTTTGDCARSV